MPGFFRLTLLDVCFSNLPLGWLRHESIGRAMPRKTFTPSPKPRAILLYARSRLKPCSHIAHYTKLPNNQSTISIQLTSECHKIHSTNTEQTPQHSPGTRATQSGTPAAAEVGSSCRLSCFHDISTREAPSPPLQRRRLRQARGS